MSKLVLSLFIVAVGISVSAKEAIGPAAEVDMVLAKYRKAKAIRARVKKTVIQEVMGSESQSHGNFYFSKGKLRLDIIEPEKTTLVYDGKFVWLESRMDTLVSVTKIAADGLKKSDSLLAALFEKKGILNTFKLLSKKIDGSAKVYVFEPKDKSNTEVQYLELSLKGTDLGRVTYRDQVENKISFEFEKLIRASVAASKFKYKPPQGAQVTEIK